MRKLFVGVLALACSLVVMAQDEDSYFVTTNNVEATPEGQNGTQDGNDPQQKKRDFISENFPHLQLCNWIPGMRFMVIPDKMDMITGVFNDAATGDRVSCGVLRHKIMIYDGYKDMPREGVSRIFFVRQDNGQRYYYETPNGLFDSYCESKLEVPALAYLNDVDQARRLFLGKSFITRCTRYRVDIAHKSDGYEEVAQPVGKKVKVVKIGVGSRAFPVKFVVQDTLGKQFYQMVTISRTNCGLREEELAMDNLRFTFEGAFTPVDDEAEATQAVATSNGPQPGKKVHLLHATTMGTEKAESEWIQEYSGFVIERVEPIYGSDYVKLVLRSINDKRLYTRQVSMKLMSDGKTDPTCAECYANIFGDGDPLRDDPEFAEKVKKQQRTKKRKRSRYADEDYERNPLPLM